MSALGREIVSQTDPSAASNVAIGRVTNGTIGIGTQAQNIGATSGVLYSTSSNVHPAWLCFPHASPFPHASAMPAYRHSPPLPKG